MEITSQDIEDMNAATQTKSKFVADVADFTDMRVSEVGYGRDEYKTSKPNILRNDAIIAEILKVSDAAETAIGHTIGPYADATLIQTFADREVPIYNTRDGFTILQNMKYTQPIPNGIFKMIREASEYMQIEVGDSTSSGIPIQNALLKAYVNIFNDKTAGKWTYSPVGIKNITEICVEEIIKGINDNPIYHKTFPKPDENGNYTKEQEDEIIKWLAKVATISANNDYRVGVQIAELHRNKLDGRGHVLTTVSKTEEEWYEDTDAFRVPVGPIDESRMNNSSDGFTWEADNPAVVMFDGSLLETDLPALKQIIETISFADPENMYRPIMLVASNYDWHIAQYLRECLDGTYYNELGECIKDEGANPAAKTKALCICGIILKNKEISEQFRFSDLKLMTGARAFSTELTKMPELSPEKSIRIQQVNNLIGTCKHISAGRAETNFVGCSPNKEEFDALIADLKFQAEKLKKVKFHMTDYTADDLFGRIDNLQARTTYYYCGGRSAKAKYSRKLLIEDANAAVEAAIKSGGVSIGGNMAICHYISHNYDKIIDNVLKTIESVRINITAAENYSSLKDIIGLILDSIRYAYGNAYRYALYNMYRTSEQCMETWTRCVESERPTIYNIMTNCDETFDSEDPDKCTTIIVPKNTDICLLHIVTETVSELINIGNMITVMSPGIDLESLQLKQLASGAAYMASSSMYK